MESYGIPLTIAAVLIRHSFAIIETETPVWHGIEFDWPHAASILTLHRQFLPRQLWHLLIAFAHDGSINIVNDINHMSLTIREKCS